MIFLSMFFECQFNSKKLKTKDNRKRAELMNMY